MEIEDFNKFILDLKQKISSMEDFTEPGKKLVELILQFQANQKLNPPFEEFSEKLITEELPDIVKNILNSDYIDDVELSNTANEILSKTALLDNEEFAQYTNNIDFAMIYDIKQSFYINNDFEPPYKHIVLTENEVIPFKSITESITKLIDYHKHLNNKLKSLDTAYRKVQIPYLQNQIVFIDSELLQDAKKLCTVYINYIDVNNDIKIISDSFKQFFDLCENFPNLLYDFALILKKFLISKKVDEQITAAQMFSTIIESLTKNKIDEVFLSFKEKINFIEILLHQHHSQVINELKESAKYLINIEDLKVFWKNVVKISHLSEQKQILDFVTTVLFNFSNDEIRAFVDYLEKEERNELTIDLLVTLKFNKDQLTHYFILAIQMAMEIKDSRKISDALDKLENSVYQDNLQEIINFISDHLDDIICVDLLSTFLANKSGYRNEMVENLTEKVIEALKKENSPKDQLVNIIVSNSGNEKPEDIKFIAENFMHPNFLFLLSNRLQNSPLDEETLEFVMNQIRNKIDFTSLNKASARCIVDSIFFINHHAGLISLHGINRKLVHFQRQFNILKQPLLYVDVLFQAYLSVKDPSAFTDLKNAIAKCFAYSEDVVSIETIKLLMNLIGDNISDKTLVLLSHILLKWDNYDSANSWGYQKHFQIMKIQYEIMFYVFDHNGIRHKYFFENMGFQEAMWKIALDLKITKQFNLKTLDGEILKQEGNLWNANIPVGETYLLDIDDDAKPIEIDFEEKEKTLPLSMYLHRIKFQHTLLSLKTKSKLVAQILRQLPDDEEIVSMTDEPDKFIDYLKDKSEFYVKYAFEVYVDRYKDIITADFLDQLLPDHPVKVSQSIVDFLSSLDDFKILVPKLIKLAVCDKAKLAKSTSTALQKVLGYLLQEEEMKYLVEKSTDATWHDLSIFITNSMPPIEMVNISLKLFEEDFNDKYVDLIVFALNTMSNISFDNENILTRCFKLLENGKKSVSKVILLLIPKVNSDEYIQYTDLLIKFAFECNNYGDYFQSLAYFIKEGRLPELSENKIIDEVKQTYDSYNYSDEIYLKSKTGFCGLRNLGATCYMNSILQQLYFTNSFIKNLLEMEDRNESDKQLKMIYRRLMHSTMKYIDTENFCKTWLGWENRPINVKEQQDASDFFNMLIDKLPDNIQQIFKGEITNTISVETENTTILNKEHFFCEPIDILNYNDLDSAIKNYTSAEQIEYRLENKKNAIASKFASITKFPDVFVLSLKRFEYNLTTFQRYKINKKFTFPSSLNVTNFTISMNEELPTYKLKGVVIHTGNVDGGHYTSIILKDDKYIYFDDTVTREITETEFENMSYGGQGDTSAFILFYSKSKEKNIKVDEEDPEIEEENLKTVRVINRFSIDFFTIITQLRNPNIIIPYFINVYLHTADVEYNKEMDKCLDEMVLNDKNNECLGITLEYMPQLKDAILNCPNNSMITVLSNFISCIIAFGDREICKIFIDEIVELFDFIENNWRKGNNICNIINNYVVQYGMTDEMKEKIEKFVDSIYSRKLSPNLLKTINIPCVFDCCASGKYLLKTQYYSEIDKGDHSFAYEKYLKVLVYEGIITNDDFMNLHYSSNFIVEQINSCDPYDVLTIKKYMSWLKIEDYAYALTNDLRQDVVYLNPEIFFFNYMRGIHYNQSTISTYFSRIHSQYIDCFASYLLIFLSFALENSTLNLSVVLETSCTIFYKKDYPGNQLHCYAFQIASDARQTTEVRALAILLASLFSDFEKYSLSFLPLAEEVMFTNGILTSEYLSSIFKIQTLDAWRCNELIANQLNHLYFVKNSLWREFAKAYSKSELGNKIFADFAVKFMVKLENEKLPVQFKHIRDADFDENAIECIKRRLTDFNEGVGLATLACIAYKKELMNDAADLMENFALFKQDTNITFMISDALGHPISDDDENLL